MSSSISVTHPDFCLPSDHFILKNVLLVFIIECEALNLLSYQYLPYVYVFEHALVFYVYAYTYYV